MLTISHCTYTLTHTHIFFSIEVIKKCIPIQNPIFPKPLTLKLNTTLTPNTNLNA